MEFQNHPHSLPCVSAVYRQSPDSLGIIRKLLTYCLESGQGQCLDTAPTHPHTWPVLEQSSRYVNCVMTISEHSMSSKRTVLRQRPIVPHLHSTATNTDIDHCLSHIFTVNTYVFCKCSCTTLMIWDHEVPEMLETNFRTWLGGLRPNPVMHAWSFSIEARALTISATET